MTLFSFKSSKALSKSTKPAPSAPSTATANGLPPSAASDVYADIPAQSLRYWPLEASKREIRVLQVHRGWKSDPMICKLYPVSLLDEPRPMYETVSYCWGDTSSTTPVKIEVNGVVVAINASAADAIHRIRTPLTDRWIWIDAICINQNDKDERNHQVALMAKIYKGAFKNVVWLGNDDEDFGEYINQEMNRALADFRSHSRAFVDIYTMTHDNMELKRDGTVADRNIDFKALAYLFDSPWFGRLWVGMTPWNYSILQG
ncbi:uncharacterized protein MYCFIDRAFT_41460 [Pseudocercospora fijiensis CIRAD86]|uniref:Heterokaryon incompatibility domain-containing protein n=1 Tax=Pseudocercospora fijiensis (strain CIRAD86) TaxID=383855 RepID=M3AKG1_PSEFD|nr:uncharacterized protein MYCFIDRAFT_41460 [Pseudocercospora fijiensis CIRAD86]EME85071.1 hypothetical protein MYCFIDRAFT_41460 [Pseudocercospora fijiensis CIRAD86]